MVALRGLEPLSHRVKIWYPYRWTIAPQLLCQRQDLNLHAFWARDPKSRVAAITPLWHVFYIWCPRRDSNSHILVDNRFWVCRVYRSTTRASINFSIQFSIPTNNLILTCDGEPLHERRNFFCGEYQSRTGDLCVQSTCFTPKLIPLGGSGEIRTRGDYHIPSVFKTDVLNQLYHASI